MKGKRILTILALGLVPVLAAGLSLAEGPTPPVPTPSTGGMQGEVMLVALGTAFTYQGQLKQDGSPVTGTCDLQFGLWNAVSGGTQIGTTQTKTNVSVTNGLFTIPDLDFGSGAFTGEARWLEIAVRCPAGSGSYTTLSPRQALTPTPYALFSESTGALQGYPVATTSPALNQVLTWNGSTWAPAATGAGDITAVYAGTGLTGGGTSGDVTLALDNSHTDGRYWKLTGNTGTNPATNFLGTTDNAALELRVSNARALRLEPSATSPNLIGGYSGNSVISGVVGATISGGGDITGPNRIIANYATISGGYNNTASGSAEATVGGGGGNTANGWAATVSGGYNNIASGPATTIGGGEENIASLSHTTIGGGHINTASFSLATVGGGLSNRASGFAATIGGGQVNTASGENATVGGGYDNTASGGYATVSGGIDNTASGDYYATVGGGLDNTASGYNATVGGGAHNTASGDEATVGGGYANTASSWAAAIGGGWNNTATRPHATVGGGYANRATAITATIGGGEYISVTGKAATVAGGSWITVTGDYAAIGGGWSNVVTGTYAAIGGGVWNTAGGSSATVSGGRANKASNDSATVGGGVGNTASGYATTVGGGAGNRASYEYATVGGGQGNTASGFAATVGGGGDRNTASATYTTVGGGAGNRASYEYATVGGGGGNTASGFAATVPGGVNAAATLYGQMAYASGLFASTGDAQTSTYVLRNTTTDATVKELFLDGSSQRLTIASGRTLTFDILVVARSSGGASAGYQIRGVIKNVGGSTALVGTPSVTILGEDVASWDVTVEADNINKALAIKVTGAVATAIRWVAGVRTVEVLYEEAPI